MSSVKARTSLFESGEAFNKKKPEAAPKKQNKKKEEEEEEDGSFQFADLVKALTGSFDGQGDSVDALQETFKILDFDQDGFITMEDLKVALAGFNEDEDEEEADEEELKEMIAAADDNGNGKISFDSFINVIDPKLAEMRNGKSLQKKK